MRSREVRLPGTTAPSDHDHDAALSSEISRPVDAPRRPSSVGLPSNAAAGVRRAPTVINRSLLSVVGMKSLGDCIQNDQPLLLRHGGA